MADKLHHFVDTNGFPTAGDFPETITPIVERLALRGIEIAHLACMPSQDHPYEPRIVRLVDRHHAARRPLPQDRPARARAELARVRPRGGAGGQKGCLVSGFEPVTPSIV